MQSQNPFFDEFAKMTANAMSLAQAAGEEAKSAMRAQADKFVAEMDLVRREDFEAMRTELAELRAEVAALKAVATGVVKPEAAKPRGRGAKPATDLPQD
ncbi:accessory factor UbiK family protein [Asticcacaulis sp. EMRT-3]|uniref:accessory factor UbiK family protein n=1 Tax=Asticcacaulis sp. EMRT-3 TaxID=3040349 RepID=UPI0024AFC804|nr:accessory factor UbiK family protein [Asticcacaulis sp. EMRT-3]MDI7774872.1 accessory factor UbiK family protein [Asticcacaulis sp. EMRT-3]